MQIQLVFLCIDSSKNYTAKFEKAVTLQHPAKDRVLCHLHLFEHYVDVRQQTAVKSVQ
jgi:hypothetical protein